MADLLPTYFSLKSKYNNKYLTYTDGDDTSNGLLNYSGTILVTPFTKFSVQPSETKKGHIHIRSCYNNKYWARSSENSNYIAAISNEQDDDKSKWSCTLFRPIFVPEQNAYYFLHVQLNMYLRIAKSDPAPYTNCLLASAEDLTNIDENNVVLDWDSIVILPKYSAFRSDNGRFLKPLDKLLQFSAPNVDDIAVTFEIILVEDAYVLVKHVDSNKNWIRRSDHWVHSESVDVTKDYDLNSLFWPIKIDNTFVGLRNKGNIHCCKKYTTSGKYNNCLSANTLKLNKSATRIEMKDVAIPEKIKDLEYNTKAARVFGKKIRKIYEGFSVNNTDVEAELFNSFDYQKEARRNWSSTISRISGFTSYFATKVPILEKNGFSFHNRDDNKWDDIAIEFWSEAVRERVVVPPKTAFKCVATLTGASYDVPFSYNRVDTLQDGREVTNRYEDGIFTGFMTYDYKFTATINP